MEHWSTRKSKELYDIEAWGKDYFHINKKGHIEVAPYGIKDSRRLDLKLFVEDLKERGMRAPFLIRFKDIINSRIQLLHNSFNRAITKYKSKSTYQGVFPIKVNQQRYLIEDLMSCGESTSLGLEAGSKAELLIALAYVQDPKALVICNGFKDAEYIKTALISLKFNRSTIIVVDRYSELKLIIDQAKKLKIKARIGFRAKLDSPGRGKWAESSGAKSKFGLTSTEMVKAIEVLDQNEMLASLELVHFHLGSQITSMRTIKNALTESCRVFVELCKLGAKLKYFDVGGGLGVDYDGSQSNWENSMNYSVQEYANEVVSNIVEACEEESIAHPIIVTEAGRALVAHHCMLVFDVVGANCMQVENFPQEHRDQKHESVQELIRLYDKLAPKNLNESIQDANQLREEALKLFNLGYLTLVEKAVIEEVYKAFCSHALKVSNNISRKPEVVESLQKYVIDSYYCNFSVFHSAPDAWAVGQQFPIMPIHRLNEQPSKKAVLLDLTCDSDGKIDSFISVKDSKKYIDLHPFDENEDYYIAMFFLGAYQETLGDIHNLFGDTDAVHVSLEEGGGYELDHVVEGDSVRQMLGYVEYDCSILVKSIRLSLEKAVKEQRLSLKDSRLILRHYEKSLSGYTYLEETE